MANSFADFDGLVQNEYVFANADLRIRLSEIRTRFAYRPLIYRTLNLKPK